jgi:hypothetical protein
MAYVLNEELSKARKKLKEDILANDLYGKKIYILGTAEFGPTNQPVLVKSTVGLYNKFGRYGTLIDAFHEIKYTSKNNDVYLVKVTGEFANAYLNVNLNDSDIIENGFQFISSQSNEVFNEISITVDTDRLWIEYPNDLNIKDHIAEFTYADYPTIGELANAINKKTDKKNGFIYAHYNVDPATPTNTAFYCCNPTMINLYGGKCGLDYSKNLLYNCLNRTYSLLESYNIDIVIPIQAFVDDIYPDDSDSNEWQYDMRYYQTTKDYLTEDMFGRQRSFLNQLINFCMNQLNFGVVTTGIIGFNPIFETESEYLSEADDISKMWLHCLEFNKNLCENPAYSFLVSIVGGDIKYNQGVITDNGYLAYAALCAETQIIQGTTNVPFANSIAIYNEFSEEILKELADNDIVSFRHSPFYDKVVVYDGITLHNTHGCGLGNYANVRMIQMCIAYINTLFQFYIGEDMVKLIEEGIVSDDLQEILSNIQSKDVIKEFEFELVPDYIHGELKVFLKLQTIYMTKTVNICTVMEITTESDSYE